MPVIPYTPEYPTLQLEILINGSNNGLHVLLKKMYISYELNKIPSAKLYFISSNPEVASEDDGLESDMLRITDEIEIRTNSGESVETLFKGIIYRSERSAEGAEGFETKIECKDIAIRLTSQQEVVPDENFTDKMQRFLNEIGMDNDVDLDIFGEESISKTRNTTPWDYLLSYLDSLGKPTTIREGVFKTIDITSGADNSSYLALNGVNVFEFEAKEEDCVSEVEVRYWNPESQTIETEVSVTEVENAMGREVIDMTQSSLDPNTLAQITLARAAKNRLASLKGRVKTFGNLAAKYGDYIEFENINPNIDGKAILITSEQHSIENGSWNTEFGFGLENNQSYAQNISTTSPKNGSIAGQSNSIQGLQIGVVTDILDPKNELRVRVRIPSISEYGDGIWARLSSFQAGNDRGAFFVPEVGDEVILGCINNNPDSPVILGKLYSSFNPPPFLIEEENNIQGIVSKNKSKIVINDEDNSIEISTDSGNKLLISEAKKGFELEDENGNKIIMNDSGITLESAKDINLSAQGNINVEGLQTTLKANAIMEISGQLVKLN
jgi:hypothetical protein